MSYEFGGSLFNTSDEVLMAMAYWHLYGDNAASVIAKDEIEDAIQECLDAWSEADAFEENERDEDIVSRYEELPKWSQEEKRDALEECIAAENAEIAATEEA